MKLKPDFSVLILDDDKVTRTMIKGLLMKKGIRNVVQAENPKEALEEMIKASTLGSPIDVLMIDWQMPKIDGIQFLSGIRKTKEYVDTPVIMITSNEAPDAKKIAIQNGVTAFLKKPISLNDLMGALVEALEVTGYE